MPPVTPLHTHPATTGLRGWRLAALVLAVLAAHGLLLARWLHNNPGTAPSPVAVETTQPAAAVTMQVTPPTPPVTAQATSSPAVRTPHTTQGARAKTAQADSADESNSHQKNAPPHTGEQYSAINSGISTSPPTVAEDRAPQPPGVRTESSAAAPANTGEPPAQGAPATGGVESATAGLTATVPGKLRLPGNTTLSYDVTAARKGVSFPASSTLRFTHDGSTYDARMEIKALFVGSRTQTSKGLVDPAAGLQPVRFGDKAKAEQAAHFDRSRQPPVLRFSANTPDAPLQAHTQDRLSVLFQLAAMLAGDPKRLGPGSTVVIHTAGPRDADMWQFKVGKAEELALPAGTLTAIHLVRTPMHAYDNQVEVWLAPSLGHLPVRVLWTQANGDTVDQRLSGHEP